MSKLRTAVIAALFMLGFYVGAYAVSVQFRRPAANMAYFIYADNGNADEFIYRLFLPLYKIHKWAGGCVHNSDREDAIHLDVGITERCNMNYEDIPSLIGLSVKAMSEIKGIVPATEFSRGYAVKTVLPNCDSYYWLGDLPILIGVKDGRIVRTTLIKG